MFTDAESGTRVGKEGAEMNQVRLVVEGRGNWAYTHLIADMETVSDDAGEGGIVLENKAVKRCGISSLVEIPSGRKIILRAGPLH